MLLAANPLANFINNNPTVVMLALGFLLMIGIHMCKRGVMAAYRSGDQDEISVHED
jgi:predicted tellurium resistance membrane protein TerC